MGVVASKLCRQLYKLLPESHTQDTLTWLVWSNQRTTLSEIPYSEYLSINFKVTTGFPLLVPAYSYGDLIAIFKNQFPHEQLLPYASPTEEEVDELAEKIISWL